MKNRVILYPGSFDPITYGHIDIINRCKKLADKLIIVVANNTRKESLLPIKERVGIIKELFSKDKSIEVYKEEGLIIESLKKFNSRVICRGLRKVSDYEYESSMAMMNNELNKDVETIFFITRPEYSFISSSMIKEIISNKGDIKQFVPSPVIKTLEKLQLL